MGCSAIVKNYFHFSLNVDEEVNSWYLLKSNPLRFVEFLNDILQLPPATENSVHCVA